MDPSLGTQAHRSRELALELVDPKEPPTGEATAAKHIRQPWRAYWPPAPGSLLYRKFQEESPEILAWRFDSARPFETPWRCWRGQVCPIESDANGHINQTKQDMGREAGPSARKMLNSVFASPTHTRHDLDEQLKQLKLPVVQSASFHYLASLDLYRTEKPYRHQMPRIDGLERTNLRMENHSITVSEISGNEHLFRLKDSGFEFAKCDVKIDNWTDKSVVEEYNPRLVEWLKQYLHCDRVFIYGYRFRRQNHDTLEWDWGGPLFRVHCDSTEWSCKAKVQLYLPEESTTLLKGRVRCLKKQGIPTSGWDDKRCSNKTSIWRPITTPEQDCPLAMCDARTVNKKDLVSIDVVYPHFVDEAYEVMYDPAHRWFYKKGMKNDDIIIFKVGDTEETEATVCVHSAFVDPSVPSDTPSRFSIEVKAIVFG